MLDSFLNISRDFLYTTVRSFMHSSKIACSCLKLFIAVFH